MSIEMERLAVLGESGGLPADVWTELAGLAAARIGGRLQLDAGSRAELQGLLAPSGAVTAEAGGTATRIAVGLAQQERTVHLVCFEGSAELASLLPGSASLSIGDLQPADALSALPVHLILEIDDGAGGVGHDSDALGRLSIEPPGRAVDDKAVVHGVADAVAALDPDIDVIVVFSAVPLSVVARSVAALTDRSPGLRAYVELGEEVRAVDGPAGGGPDGDALHHLGPAVTVSMNEPTWIGLTGSSDVGDEALAATYLAWGCGAIVVHRESDTSVITGDEATVDLACLRRGVAMATLFAETGVLPSSAEVDARMQTITGATRTWRPEEASGRTVRRSRVGVPVCRRPSRTVGLGDAFAAGFLAEMGAGSARRPALPAAAHR